MNLVAYTWLSMPPENSRERCRADFVNFHIDLNEEVQDGSRTCQASPASLILKVSKPFTEHRRLDNYLRHWNNPPHDTLHRRYRDILC